jgi:hypothetical protein
MEGINRSAVELIDRCSVEVDGRDVGNPLIVQGLRDPANASRCEQNNHLAKVCVNQQKIRIEKSELGRGPVTSP